MSFWSIPAKLDKAKNLRVGDFRTSSIYEAVFQLSTPVLNCINKRNFLYRFQHLCGIGVPACEPPAELYLRSLELAVDYGTTNAYDTLYMALAEIEGCELWTADDP